MKELRRHRRLAVALVTALALVLLAGALVTLVGDRGDPDVRLAVAGPAPTTEVAGAGQVSPAAPPTTTTAEPPDRLEVRRAHPRTSPPRPDDPAAQPAPTDPSGSSSSPVLPPSPSTTVAPGTGPAPKPCPASEVGVTVSTEKTTYAPGETVRGSSTLENRSAGACLLPTRAFFRVLNEAGDDAGSFSYTADFRFPVPAEPGKTFTSSFTWDQKDCTGPACTQVPAGTYTAVADWTESGPYRGRSTFGVA